MRTIMDVSPRDPLHPCTGECGRYYPDSQLIHYSVNAPGKIVDKRICKECYELTGDLAELITGQRLPRKDVELS